ncbi:MAG: hypothetical protein Q8Q14_12655 [Gemmatimonadales bacterium]|nr:hypothetical protein [Gemmatimonadales bacterium]
MESESDFSVPFLEHTPETLWCHPRIDAPGTVWAFATPATPAVAGMEEIRFAVEDDGLHLDEQLGGGFEISAWGVQPLDTIPASGDQYDVAARRAWGRAYGQLIIGAKSYGTAPLAAGEFRLPIAVPLAPGFSMKLELHVEAPLFVECLAWIRGTFGRLMR